MRLSIVLTIYNKEPFLRRALDSLLGQQGIAEEDYEVLAVNDGSTDGSAAILEEYANRNACLRVLTQENQGLSMARNNGVDAVRGEYVWFVDADDIFSPDAVSKICKAMTSEPDIIPMYAKTEGEDRVRNKICTEAKTGKEILVHSQWEPCGVFTVAKRDFLKKNNLRFLPGIYHEDDEYTPRMLYAAQSVEVVPEILYTVIHEPNSITGVPRSKRAFDYITVSESLGRFVKKNGEDSTEIGKAICSHAALCINNSLYVILQNSKDEQKRYNEVFEDKRKTLISILLASPQWKYKLEGILFKMFKGKYIGIYKALQSIR